MPNPIDLAFSILGAVGGITMIEQVRNQIQALRVKLDSDLFFLYEQNNLISESNHMLSLSAKMYALTDEAKLEITNTNGNYEITKKATIRLAEKFINQDFKNNLDNIIERGLFSTFLWIALTEFFIGQNDNEQILNCLCIANRVYGSTLAAKNEYYSAEIGKAIVSAKFSIGGNARAEKYKLLKNEVFKKWRLGSFHSYAECARDFNKDYDLSAKTIENWLSKEFSNSKERS